MITSGQIMVLARPAYRDRYRTTKCGLPAEVSCQFVINSSDGSFKSVMIRCPSDHPLKGPIEFLTIEKPACASRAPNQKPLILRPGGTLFTGIPTTMNEVRESVF